MASKGYALKDGTKLTERRANALKDIYTFQPTKGMRISPSIADWLTDNHFVNRGDMWFGKVLCRITDKGIEALRELGLIEATPPAFKQGDKVRVDNPGSALHNEEGEYQHELYADHSAVIFPQLSKHAKSIWTHTLRLVEADTPPAAPSEGAIMNYGTLPTNDDDLSQRLKAQVDSMIKAAVSRVKTELELTQAELAAAIQERDELRRKLKVVVRAAYVFTEQLRVEEAMADGQGYQVNDNDEIPIIARYFRELFAAVEAAKKES